MPTCHYEALNPKRQKRVVEGVLSISPLTERQAQTESEVVQTNMGIGSSRNTRNGQTTLDGTDWPRHGLFAQNPAFCVTCAGGSLSLSFSFFLSSSLPLFLSAQPSPAEPRRVGRWVVGHGFSLFEVESSREQGDLHQARLRVASVCDGGTEGGISLRTGDSGGGGGGGGLPEGMERKKRVHAVCSVCAAVQRRSYLR
jgi:hypothetical protein